MTASTSFTELLTCLQKDFILQYMVTITVKRLGGYVEVEGHFEGLKLYTFFVSPVFFVPLISLQPIWVY